MTMADRITTTVRLLRKEFPEISVHVRMNCWSDRDGAMLLRCDGGDLTQIPRYLHHSIKRIGDLIIRKAYLKKFGGDDYVIVQWRLV